uniref:FAD-dependent protein n=1 Tax=Salmonella sp. SAL4359 TaxID=3159880 RepID=UPI003978B7BD
IETEDMNLQEFGALAGLRMQQELEQRAWQMGGKTQVAPAQLLKDFVNRKVSAHLLETSYQPGLRSVDMHAVLGENLAQRLVQGFQA